MLKIHLSRERSRSLRAAKVKQVHRQTGKLECEVCAVDFEREFAGIGLGFCEVHHLRPVASLSESGPSTDLNELAVVCPNCHRMLHRKAPPIEITELRKIRSLTSPSADSLTRNHVAALT